MPCADPDLKALLRASKTKETGKMMYSEFLNFVLPNKRKRLREKVRYYSVNVLGFAKVALKNQLKGSSFRIKDLVCFSLSF